MYQTLIDRGIKKVYHFTDKSNIESIVNCGGLLSLANLKRNKVKDVKYGGNQWSHDADAYKGGDGYVHLCFLKNHPMEHIAREVEKRIEETCWLEIDISALNTNGVMYSSGVSNKSGVQFLSPDDAKEAIDLEGIYEFLNFKVEGNQERKNNARKYEILIPNTVPLDKILNISSFRG